MCFSFSECFLLSQQVSTFSIPPLVPEEGATDVEGLDATAATALVERISQNVCEAQDNLLTAKISQAEFANRHRGDEIIYVVGDKVMLSTIHRRREYIQKHSGCVAKFLLHFDGPFLVTKTHPEKSSYTLELPNEPDCFATFHAPLLRPHVPNDNDLYPSRRFAQPGPVVTADGTEEWVIDCIIDERTRGRGRQYLVRWQGWGAEEDRWLPGRELSDTEALDDWLRT